MPYTDLDNLIKDYLPEATKQAEKESVGRILEAVSAFVDSYCRRPAGFFNPSPADGSMKRIRGEGERYLRLPVHVKGTTQVPVTVEGVSSTLKRITQEQADALLKRRSEDVYQSAILSAADTPLSRNNAVSVLARRNQPEQQNANLGVQERLQKQFDIVEKLRNTSNLAETASAADKRIIALTSGVNPNDLTLEQRIQAAASREREADRTERSEADAVADRKEQLKIQKELNENMKRLREIAEKDGIKGIIELLEVKVTDASGGANSSLTPSPTQADTANTYNFGGFSLSGGSNC